MAKAQYEVDIGNGTMVPVESGDGNQELNIPEVLFNAYIEAKTRKQAIRCTFEELKAEYKELSEGIVLLEKVLCGSGLTEDVQ